MPNPGALRFNTDSLKLELFDGNQWTEIVASYAGDFPASESSGTRAVFGGGGGAPSYSNIIDYITVESTGNANDFGDLTQAGNFAGALASTTRGVFGGRYSPGNQNTIDFVTISTQGNAADFGDLQEGKRGPGGASNAVRGLFAGGYTPTSPAGDKNIIDYITISTLGNAQDFGDLTRVISGFGAFASSTRAVFGGGPVPAQGNIIDYVQIMSKGNAVDFGDLNYSSGFTGAVSNGHGGL